MVLYSKLRRLKSYFCKDDDCRTPLSCALGIGSYNHRMSKFKDSVLKAVSLVPKGKVVSYGQVALMVGIPRAAIQVGWVLHAFGDSVPWWRVVNKKGRISTTCLEHDANMQKTLLEKDGVKVSDDLMIDMDAYRFNPDGDFLEKFGLEDNYIQALLDKYRF